jgi:hypothetical protein
MPSIDIQGTQLNADEISLVAASITKALAANEPIQARLVTAATIDAIAVQVLTDLAAFRAAKPI